jgi:hypothetical protein
MDDAAAQRDDESHRHHGLAHHLDIDAVGLGDIGCPGRLHRPAAPAAETAMGPVVLPTSRRIVHGDFGALRAKVASQTQTHSNKLASYRRPDTQRRSRRFEKATPHPVPAVPTQRPTGLRLGQAAGASFALTGERRVELIVGPPASARPQAVHAATGAQSWRKSTMITHTGLPEAQTAHAR